jgi:hypothetical protein
MKLSTLANVIHDLRDCIPESLRTLVAHRAIQGFLNDLPVIARNAEGDAEIVQTFHTACGLTTDLPFVAHDIQLCDSDLAKFCNRWMAVEKYCDPEDGEWRFISPEMNQIRYTMCKELETLAQGPEAIYKGSQHVCGLQGYNPIIDPPCPACVERDLSRKQQPETD